MFSLFSYRAVIQYFLTLYCSKTGFTAKLFRQIQRPVQQRVFHGVRHLTAFGDVALFLKVGYQPGGLLIANCFFFLYGTKYSINLSIFMVFLAHFYLFLYETFTPPQAVGIYFIFILIFPYLHNVMLFYHKRMGKEGGMKPRRRACQKRRPDFPSGGFLYTRTYR